MRTTDSERYNQGWPEGNNRHDKAVTPELYAHPWFFYSPNAPKTMCTTQKAPVPTYSIGTKTTRTIGDLVENFPMSYYLNNLHTMMVGWMRNRRNDPHHEKDEEQVYHTYLELKNLLTVIEQELAGQNITPLP